MIPNPFLDALMAGVPAATVGALGGWAYFRMLRLTVESFVEGRGWRRAVLLSLGRLSGVGAMLWIAAQFGAVPLLAAFAGFLLARRFALAAARKAETGRAG
jgi:hypothetical protein